MTTFTKLVLSAALLSGLAACAAPAAEVAVVEAADAPQKPELHTRVATIKPGANVTLNSVLPKTMVSGEFQTVQLSLTDSYSDGDLAVTIKPSAGLRIFGGSDNQTFDMSKDGTHDFDLNVSADSDGVYFLNVFVTAQGTPRSFSVRLNIGQVTQKMFDDAMPADGELTDGGAVRALDADEVIR